MTHTFKPGDFAMVEIVGPYNAGREIILRRHDGHEGTHIAASYLRPIPPALTPEETAVIETARSCRRSRSETAFDALYGAVDALEASLPPPDPIPTAPEPDANGWLPIDCAPRDGTHVLVYAAEFDGLPAFQTVASYHPDAGWCVCGTHWQPLPKGPAP